MPSSTWGRQSERAMRAKVERSRLSSETLMRFTPASASPLANSRRRTPLVVRVSSSRAPSSRCRDRARTRSMIPLRISGSPPVRRSLRTPRRTKAAQSALQFFQGQHLRLGQKLHVLAHAIGAAQIAAVGDRDAHVIDRAPESVVQTWLCSAQHNGQYTAEYRPKNSCYFRYLAQSSAGARIARPAKEAKVGNRSASPWPRCREGA